MYITRCRCLLICSSFLCPLLFYSDAAEIFFTSSRIPFTSAFSVVFTQTRSAVNCSALLLSNPRCTWYRDWRIHLGIMLNQVKSENKDCNSCHSPIVSVSLWSCRTKWWGVHHWKILRTPCPKEVNFTQKTLKFTQKTLKLRKRR